MKAKPANGWQPEDLTAPQLRVLVKLHHTCFVRGADVRVARALERMGLAELEDYGSSPIDGTHNGDGERWQAPLTDEGNALAQRQMDREHDEEQDMWIERDELRERRVRLKEELAAVEKRLAVLDGRPS